MLFDSSLGIWDLENGELVTMLQRRGDRDKVCSLVPPCPASRLPPDHLCTLQEFVHSGGINGVLLSSDGSVAVTYAKVSLRGQ